MASSNQVSEKATLVCKLWSNGEDLGDAIAALGTAVEAEEPYATCGNCDRPLTEEQVGRDPVSEEVFCKDGEGCSDR